MESIENIPEYHSFISQSMTALVECLANNRTQDAKRLLKFNIEYAYTLCRTKEVGDDPTKVIGNIRKEIKEMKLDDSEIDELVIRMTTYQSIAGLKPTQHMKLEADTFSKVKPRLFRD